MKNSIPTALRAFALITATFLAPACASTESEESEASEDDLNLSEIDEYARAFIANDGIEPRTRSAPVSSPFPYECQGCDIRGNRPITGLVDARLVNAVRSYSCEAGTEHKFVPFFPGIQAFNDSFIPGVRTRLGGDKALANLYLKYALRAVTERSSEVPGSWSLLNYYNASTLDRKQPGAGVFVSPIEASPDRGVRSFARANHSSVRSKDDDEYRDGDQVEARLIGLWSSTPRDEDFISQSPQFLAPGEMASRDARDFERFRTAVHDDPAWMNFMYRATYEVAIAFKCDRPVFAHSGGGAIVGWITRLLSVSELKNDLRASSHEFKVVGLEAVLSNEMNRRMHDAVKVNMQQFVVGERGSSTYHGVIAKECVEIGQTPLNHVAVYGDVNPPGWNGDGGGHGGLGFFLLQYGRITGQPKFF
jgi:hypothetical protein